MLLLCFSMLTLMLCRLMLLMPRCCFWRYAATLLFSPCLLIAGCCCALLLRYRHIAGRYYYSRHAARYATLHAIAAASPQTTFKSTSHHERHSHTPYSMLFFTPWLLACRGALDVSSCRHAGFIFLPPLLLSPYAANIAASASFFC